MWCSKIGAFLGLELKGCMVIYLYRVKKVKQTYKIDFLVFNGGNNCRSIRFYMYSGKFKKLSLEIMDNSEKIGHRNYEKCAETGNTLFFCL